MLKGEELAEEDEEAISRREKAVQGSRSRSSTTRPSRSSLRRHLHRRVPPLDLRPVAPGAGVLRRLPDRPDRHARQADLRLLQPEPGHGVRPRAGGGRRRQRRLRRLPHPHRDHRGGLDQSRPATSWTSATARRAPRAGSSSTRTSSTTPNQLDRNVVATDQIRTVVRTFRDKLFTEIFPGRTEVPKTLIFAKDDSHAEDIVKIVREEFGKGNDFCAEDHLPAPRARSPKTCIADVPQQLQPAHRRHRRHDRHRHRRQAAGDA